MSIVPGTRCRLARAITLPGVIVRRATPGTLVSLRENLGRKPFTVRFDGGQQIIVFAHEIEFASEELVA